MKKLFQFIGILLGLSLLCSRAAAQDESDLSPVVENQGLDVETPLLFNTKNFTFLSHNSHGEFNPKISSDQRTLTLLDNSQDSEGTVAWFKPAVQLPFKINFSYLANGAPLRANDYGVMFGFTFMFGKSATAYKNRLPTTGHMANGSKWYAAYTYGSVFDNAGYQAVFHLPNWTDFELDSGRGRGIWTYGYAPISAKDNYAETEITVMKNSIEVVVNGRTIMDLNASDYGKSSTMKDHIGFSAGNIRYPGTIMIKDVVLTKLN